MRKTLLLLFATLTVCTRAQVTWNKTYQQYIDQFHDIAIEQMLRHKVPASITLAQGLLESAAGQSELARKGNNHFGIKCHGWSGASVYHNDDLNNECFRAYPTAYDSFEDHSLFLVGGRRYQDLFKLKLTDYKGWARGLKAAGYATNPQYADRLIEIIQLYRLYDYDKAKTYDHVMSDHARDPKIGGQPLHPIKAYNKNYYLTARPGDTYASIAQELGMKAKKLAFYNERGVEDVLQNGEIVWLKKKQGKAPKEYKGRPHYVRAGDSMYSIAQKYGIRLKSLYQLNSLSPDFELKVGDMIWLR